MTDAPFRYCLACRALAVIVLTAGIALAFDGLGSTLERKSGIERDMAVASPIMLIEPTDTASSPYPGPSFPDAGPYGEI